MSAILIPSFSQSFLEALRSWWSSGCWSVQRESIHKYLMLRQRAICTLLRKRCGNSPSGTPCENVSNLDDCNRNWFVGFWPHTWLRVTYWRGSAAVSLEMTLTPSPVSSTRRLGETQDSSGILYALLWFWWEMRKFWNQCLATSRSARAGSDVSTGSRRFVQLSSVTALNLSFVSIYASYLLLTCSNRRSPAVQKLLSWLKKILNVTIQSCAATISWNLAFVIVSCLTVYSTSDKDRPLCRIPCALNTRIIATMHKQDDNL